MFFFPVKVNHVRSVCCVSAFAKVCMCTRGPGRFLAVRFEEET